LLLKQAISIANKVKANAILVNMETVADIAPFGKTVEKGFMVIFVTKRKVCLEKASGLQCETILLPDVHLTRDGYMKLGFLEGISKGLLSKGDVVVHVGGQLEKGYMDTIVVMRVGDESEIVSFTEESPFPPNIQH